jgi:hypothetical protein
MASYADELFEIARAVTHDESVTAHDVVLEVAEAIGHEFDLSGEVGSQVAYALDVGLGAEGIKVDEDLKEEIVERATANAFFVLSKTIEWMLDENMKKRPLKKKRAKRR